MTRLLLPLALLFAFAPALAAGPIPKGGFRSCKKKRPVEA